MTALRPLGPIPRVLSIVIALLLLALLPGAAAAATWHVSPTGSDSAAGSQSAPFRTIARATSGARAGDTVLVQPGRYTESVTLGGRHSGVVIRGAGPTRPVVDGEGVRSFGIDNQGASDLTIDNLEFTRQTAAGVVVRGDRNVVQNTLVHHVGARSETHSNGVRVSRGRGHRIVGNTVHHIGPGAESMGIWLLETRDARVEGNVVYLVRKEGIRDWKGLDNVLTRNRSFLNWVGLSLNTSTGSLVSDNVAHDNVQGIVVKHASWGTVLSLWGLATGRMTRVEHNTSSRNTEAGIWIGQSDAPLDHVDVRENLFAGAGTAFIRDAPTLRGPNVTLDRNAYSNEGGTPSWLYKAGYSSTPGLGDWESVRRETGWEQNPPPSDAGARFAPPAAPSWTSYAMRPVHASSLGTYWTKTHIDKTSDNRQHTYWMTATNRNEFVVWDLGAERRFDHLVLTIYSDQDLRNPRGYRFEVSSDGLSWQTVHAGTNPDPAGAAYFYELDAPATGRYLRFTMVDTFCRTVLLGEECGDAFVLSDVKAGLLEAAPAPAPAPVAEATAEPAPAPETTAPSTGATTETTPSTTTTTTTTSPKRESKPRARKATAYSAAASRLAIGGEAVLRRDGRLELALRCGRGAATGLRVSVTGERRGKAVRLGRARLERCRSRVAVRVGATAARVLRGRRISRVRVSVSARGARTVTTSLRVRR